MVAPQVRHLSLLFLAASRSLQPIWFKHSKLLIDATKVCLMWNASHF
jgi:hypothetical protein